MSSQTPCLWTRCSITSSSRTVSNTKNFHKNFHRRITLSFFWLARIHSSGSAENQRTIAHLSGVTAASETPRSRCDVSSFCRCAPGIFEFHRTSELFFSTSIAAMADLTDSQSQIRCRWPPPSLPRDRLISWRLAARLAERQALVASLAGGRSVARSE